MIRKKNGGKKNLNSTQISFSSVAATVCFLVCPGMCFARYHFYVAITPDQRDGRILTEFSWLEWLEGCTVSQYGVWSRHKQ